MRFQAVAAILLSACALACARPLSAAAAQPGLPVAFEGSALLLPYYSGVSQALLNASVIVPGRTSLSGLSGGAFTSTWLHLGLDGPAMRQLFVDIIQECAKMPGGCVGRMNSLAEPMLEKLLPVNAHQLVNGKLRVALSQLDASKASLEDSASWVVDRFPSRMDLKSALTATDYIACWTGETTYTLFRNQPVIDGGYANGFKELCPGGDVARCLKVASWHVGAQADTACDAGRCGAEAAAAGCKAADRTSTIHKLYPNTEPFVDQWPLASIEQHCPLEQYNLTMPNFVPHNQVTPDIHPGRFGPLPSWDGRPLLACEWQSWSMQLPQGREMEAIEVIYQQGLSDGRAWLAQQARRR